MRRAVNDDVMSRLAAMREAIANLSAKLDEFHASLSRAIDETRAMFEQVISRLDASAATRNRPRRSKKP